MKIFCLYYKDTFVVGYNNREDCISYGKKHYEGYEWDCNILEKYLHDYPTFLHSSPSLESVQLYNKQYTPPLITQKTPFSEQNIPDIWYGVKADK